jgi:predicted HD phosphohydrolase
MKTVEFTAMKNGTKEDYLLLRSLEEEHNSGTAERVIRELKRQAEETLPGYKISRLEHGLQSASRAHREGADVDWVVGALLHDIGDGLAPQNHDRLAAEILRPFLREEVVWTVEHHGAFQMYYYAHHYGWNQHEREKYRDSIYFKSCADFCERWDQSSFDPGYASETLDFFLPMIREVFGRKPHAEEVIRKGAVHGLPRMQAQAQ